MDLNALVRPGIGAVRARTGSLERALALTMLLILSFSGSAYGQERSDLHEALFRGDFEAAKKLTTETVEPDLRAGHGGITPLMLAAQKGQLEIAALLVDKGASIGLKDSWGWTALMYALRYGHHDLAEFLIEKGANARDKGAYFWTTLMIAAAGGSLDSVKMILGEGVGLNWGTLRSGENDPPACVAFKLDHDEIAHFLLEQGAKTTGCDPYNSEPGLAGYAVGKLAMYRAAKSEEAGEVPTAVKHYRYAVKNFQSAEPRLLLASKRLGARLPLERALYYATSRADPTVVSMRERREGPFEEMSVEYADMARKCQEYLLECKKNIERLER